MCVVSLWASPSILAVMLQQIDCPLVSSLIDMLDGLLGVKDQVLPVLQVPILTGTMAITESSLVLVEIDICQGLIINHQQSKTQLTSPPNTSSTLIIGEENVWSLLPLCICQKCFVTSHVRILSFSALSGPFHFFVGFGLSKTPNQGEEALH